MTFMRVATLSCNPWAITLIMAQDAVGQVLVPKVVKPMMYRESKAALCTNCKEDRK
ncbi:hypothetical protein GCM10028895_53170 [Pontibacter rugosus]